ncbi:MAG: peptidylprolyl isomerase [Holosporaceae bacterium]|jgi:peptidyl-prolyl cis-trans isomerase C|nr:peptidylprolyl isomerase [Holosporaceae bacterium]
MILRICCAVTALSAAFLASQVEGGALKDFFTKKGQSETKIEEQNASSESNEATEDSSNKSETAESDKKGSSDKKEAGEKKKIVGDPIVLRVGKKEWRRSQVLADMRLIPPQLIQGISPDKLFEMLRDQKLNAYLMVEQAKKAGLDRTKEFVERVEQFKEELLARLFLMRELAPKAENESVLKARYTKYLVEFKKGKEFQILHIMIATEDEAKSILASLAKGEDFAKLAKDKSLAPSKDKGGDEGYIPVDLMPPQIKDKLILLKTGEYTKEAIKTENGYHIFKVGEIRETAPQKYEDAIPMLKQTIMHEEMVKLIDRLEKQVKVERFNEDGTPAAPRPAAQQTNRAQ